jgi:hypothetical protein
MPTLQIDIAARFAQFSDSLNKIERNTAASVQRMRASFVALGRIIGTVGVTIGTAAFAGIVKQSIQAAAALDDLSEITGSSVENLSKLDQVARISGIGLETVELGLVRLTKALAGADDESKGAARALAQIGLSAAELRTLDPADALQKIAVALSKYADGAGKTNIAQQIFKKGGEQLLPLLKDMATVGNVHARVTGEQAAQAEQLQKQIARLKVEFGGAAQAIALNFIAPLTRFFALLSEGIRLLREFRREAAELATFDKFGLFFEKRAELLKFKQQQEALALTEGLGGGRLDPRDLGPAAALEKLPFEVGGEDAANKAKKAAEAIKSFIDNLKKQREELRLNEVALTLYNAQQLALEHGLSGAATTKFLENVRAIAQQTQELKQQDEVLEKTRDAFADFTDKQLEAGFAMRAVIDDIRFETGLIGRSNEERELAIALRRIENETIDKQSEKYAKLAENIRNAFKEREAKVIVDQQTRSLLRDVGVKDIDAREHEKLIAEREKARSLAIGGFLSADELEKEEHRITASIINIGNVAKETKDPFEDLKRSIEGFGRDTSKVFVDLLFTGKGSFRDLIQSMIRELAELAVYKAIFQPLFNSFGGFVTKGLVAHSGGIIGFDSLPSRHINALAFAGAPRLHSGFLPGEFPAILQKGEAVFTKKQQDNLVPASGGMVVNNSITVTGAGANLTGPSQGNEMARSLQAVLNDWAQRESRPGGFFASRNT